MGTALHRSSTKRRLQTSAFERHWPRSTDASGRRRPQLSARPMLPALPLRNCWRLADTPRRLSGQSLPPSRSELTRVGRHRSRVSARQRRRRARRESRHAPFATQCSTSARRTASSRARIRTCRHTMPRWLESKPRCWQCRLECSSALRQRFNRASRPSGCIAVVFDPASRRCSGRRNARDSRRSALLRERQQSERAQPP